MLSLAKVQKFLPLLLFSGALLPFTTFALTSPALSVLMMTSSNSNAGSSTMKSNNDDDAKAYNEYASAAFELSNGHVSKDGLFTVMRSVRDIDNNKRRRYLYSIMLPPPTSTQQDWTPTPNMFIPPPVEVHASMAWRLPSPSGAIIAILRKDDDKTTNDDSSSSSQILEIWVDQGHVLERRIQLPSQHHGNVIFDTGGFGRPSWNSDETALVYAAERKAPKTASFFDDNDNNNTPNTAEDTAVVRGGQYTMGLGKVEHWGEKYSQQSPLLDLYCVNVQTGNVGRVENVPGASNNVNQDVGSTDDAADATTSTPSATTLGGYTLGQPVFSPDGNSIVYVGWDAGGGSEMPRRLGLIYCQQRPSQLYSSSIEHLMNRLSATTSKNDPDEEKTETKKDKGFQILSPGMRLARSPRFSPVAEHGQGDGDEKGTTAFATLVFLGSKDGFDTHSGCLALHALEWKVYSSGGPDLASSRVVVKEVRDPRQSPVSYGDVSGLTFPGLFLLELPESCFVSREHLILTTQWGSTSKVVRVSLSDGKVSLVPCGDNASSSALLCVTHDGSALVKTNAPNLPGVVSLVPAGSLLSEEESLLSKDDTSNVCDVLSMKPIASTRFSAVSKLEEAFPFTYDIDVRKPPQVAGVDFDLDIQSLLLLPNGSSSGDKKPPLIVVPHGGPHSASCSNYLPSYAFLCGHGGYAILMVNYRGSTGFGQGSIESLPNQVGNLDVNDVVSVTKQVRDSGLVDPDRVGICGGSHGGFLTGHCTGQFPDLFKAAAMRNPVVNICSMTTATDIPDWCFVEACGRYQWSEYRPPTREELLAMHEKSPVSHVAKVQAPTLVALGLSDLRVPPSQGLEWYHTLRSMGVPTKLLAYEKDDHAIAGVQSEADHWVNIKQWFDQHL